MKLIVIDGFDGSGKTTLSKNLANHYNGIYLKPFEESGSIIKLLHENKQYEAAHLVASYSINRCFYRNEKKFIFVDRHWLSMSVFAREEYLSFYEPLPITILCRASIDIIEERLISRGEVLGGEEQIYFHKRYDELAEKYKVPVVDTSNITEEECLQNAISIIEEVL